MPGPGLLASWPRPSGTGPGGGGAGPARKLRYCSPNASSPAERTRPRLLGQPSWPRRPAPASGPWRPVSAAPGRPCATGCGPLVAGPPIFTSISSPGPRPGRSPARGGQPRLCLRRRRRGGRLGGQGGEPGLRPSAGVVVGLADEPGRAAFQHDLALAGADISSEPSICTVPQCKRRQK